MLNQTAQSPSERWDGDCAVSQAHQLPRSKRLARKCQRRKGTVAAEGRVEASRNFSRML